MSLFDVYCSLRTGATLCIATEKLLLFPRLLVDFAEAEKVTIWKGVASLLMYLARTEAVTVGRLPALQKVLFSGEVLHTKYLMQWMDMFPHKTFYNAYGPTEATGISMYYQVEQAPRSAEERIPLGKPCENTEVFLLDENGKPVAPGEPGELYIKGICVTKGYFNDPGKTAAVFSDDPLKPMCEGRTYRTGDYACLRPDGNYEFLGRKDNQVKYMGYRIELSDIEQSLVSIPGVRDAGVVLAESTTDNLDELVAYIEIDEKVSLSDIVPALRSKLPLYMIPKQLFTIARVPRAISGKIDRQALLAYHREKSHK
jgi:non-ribosomal peptide synthetase component F